MGEPSAHPVLSVIIAHHKGRRFIDACLHSIRASVFSLPFEVIVVTSAEGPDRDFWEEGLDLHKLTGPPGPAGKRNLGVQYAKGNIIVFLDDDTEVSPYTLYEFYHGFQALPAAGMLFARIYNAERRQELDDCGSWLTWTGFLYARASRLHLPLEELMRPTRCLASKSAGCTIRREVFYHAGGFDPDYFILGEETDLAWRVWLRGYEVWYWPPAVLWHWFNTGAKPVTDYYTLGRIHTRGCHNYLRLLTTNLGLVSLLRTLPWHLLGWAVAALGFLARGQPQRAQAIGQGFVDYLRTLPATLTKRRRVQTMRRRSDKELFTHARLRVPWSYYLKRMTQYWFNPLHG